MRLTIPNQLTILRIVLTPIFVYYYLHGSAQDQLIASVVFLLASLTDWYDGWFARRFGVISRWGQFMDPLADKLLVSAALILFAWLNYVKGWMVWIIVFRDVMVTAIRIYALQKGTPVVTHVLAKWKTFSQMTTIFVILIYMNWLNYYGTGSASYQAQYFDLIGICMMVVTLLTVISAVIYIYSNWQLIWRIFKKLFSFVIR